MVYKRFRWVIIARILFLSALIFLLNYLLLETEYIAAVIIIAGLIIYNIFMLVHYVEKTNRDLARFLDAVKYSDFSQTFMLTGLGSSFNELKTAFNDVIAKFQQARAEKEESFRYLQTVVQHVGIGLLAYDDNGEINLLNSAAKRLLEVTHLKNISQLERRSVALVNTLKSLETGQRSLIKLHRSGEEMQLAIYTTEFLMQSERFRLVSIQNIGSELAETEMEAWQKLIRVLTHEIM
ncbi:MAG: ATP-binding protein, partial [Calditrichaeota bacterium]|nr:ATP-binding protein [Calditrichota bacterium]